MIKSIFQNSKNFFLFFKSSQVSNFPKFFSSITPTKTFKCNDLKNPLKEFVNLKENNLCNNQGAHKKAKRLGRGRASNHGKSSGHGMRGQEQRVNKKKFGFEGGQTPIMRRLPKLGRTKQNQQRLNYLNLDKIIYFLRRNWISSNENKYITLKDLVDSGAVTKIKHGLKILGRGEKFLNIFNKPIFIEVNHISKIAYDAIIANGGKVRIVYMTKLKIREHLKPENFDIPLRNPLPSKDAIMKLEEYRSWGCEVVYNIPRWVSEELKSNSTNSNNVDKPSYEEIKIKTQKRTKPILPKQYDFSF